MKYMLDTNIISYINTDRYGVNRAFEKHRNDQLYISAIVFAELEYGVFKSTRRKLNQDNISLMLSNITILPFDEKASFEYGALRADLERNGTVIGSNDMLIAAHAKSLDMTLVTNNMREFRRVEGLKLENWIDDIRN